MTGHDLILDDLGRWGFGRKFQSRCTCRLWESRIEDNRPDAIRHHTVHVHAVMTGIYA